MLQHAHTPIRAKKHSVCELMLEGDGATYILYPFAIPHSAKVKSNTNSEEVQMDPSISTETSGVDSRQSIVLSLYSANKLDINIEHANPDIVVGLANEAGVDITSNR